MFVHPEKLLYLSTGIGPQKVADGLHITLYISHFSRFEKFKTIVYRFRVKLYRKFSKVLFQPVKRLSGSPQKQILFDSLNKVIENHQNAPAAALSRRKGNFDKPKKIYYNKFNGHKTKVRLTERNKHYQDHNKKDILYKQSTKRLLVEISLKKAFKKINNARKRNLNEKDKEQKIVTKKTKNNEWLFSKIHHPKPKNAKKLASEMKKTTYFFQPMSETTEKHVRFTIKDSPSYQPAKTISKTKVIFAKNNTPNYKIDKLKEIIADQIFQDKAENYISKSEQKNIVRNDISDDEEETEDRGLEISETGM